jgi:hypothetical protein
VTYADDDWTTVASFTDVHQAFVLQACLQAAGVPAEIADAHMAQTHSLLAGAIPARLQVPHSWHAQALRVLEAFERGEFALPDDYTSQPNEGDAA